MSQITEAVCLLESGSMYSRRLGLKGPTGEPIFAGVKPGGVSLYFGDAPIYHFDLDGRWQRAFVEGRHYLKGLDATVRSIDRERESSGMVLHRETLAYAIASDLDASIRSVALELIDDLDSGRFEVLPISSRARAFTLDDFRAFLDRVAAWDSAAWFAHRERYLAAYGPLPFLPPDLPNPLILQATLGHVDGRAFGGARPAEPYVRSADEFRDHVKAVAALTGRRLGQHRGIFLGGADLLHRPVEEILDFLGTTGSVFSKDRDQPEAGEAWDDYQAKLGSIHAFLDDFGPPLPDLDGWRALQASGLSHVCLGVESGDPEILASFGKTWDHDRLIAVVEVLQSAKIDLSLVVLVGVGGRELSGRHLEATTTLLRSLPLRSNTLISLVDARILQETRGDDPLVENEVADQTAALKRPWEGAASKGPKVVVYNPIKRWT